MNNTEENLSRHRARVGGARTHGLPAEAASPLPRAELLNGMLLHTGGGPTENDIVDPDVTVLEELDRDGYVRRHIRYLVMEDEPAYAYLLLPKPWPGEGAKHPLVFCLHPTYGAGKDRVAGEYPDPPRDELDRQQRLDRRYAVDLARRGFVCFAPDRFAYGQRRLLENETNVRKQMDFARDRLNEKWPGWGGSRGKIIWDLQRAMDFLLQYDWIDRERIGAIGHSLGAWDSMFFAALDERIGAAVVNSAATLDFDRRLWEDHDYLREYLKNYSAHHLYRDVNICIMLTAPRPLLMIKPLNDEEYEKGQPNLLEGFRMITDHYIRKREDDGGAKPPFSIYIHNDDHSFTSEARALAYAWLRRYLRADL